MWTSCILFRAKAVTFNVQFDGYLMGSTRLCLSCIFCFLALQVNVYLQLFNMEASNRARYNNLTNACLNWRLQQRQYEVQARSVVEYCDTAATAGKVSDEGRCHREPGDLRLPFV